MAPERDLTDSLCESTKDNHEDATNGTPGRSTHMDDDLSKPSQSRMDSADIDNEFDTTSPGSSQTGHFWTNNRTESTATDDSGIAAEFDSSNATDDDDVLSNSLGLKICSSPCAVNQLTNEDSPVKSDSSSDSSCNVPTTPTRRLHHPSTEDSTCSSPRSSVCSSPRTAAESWSPRRGSATDILAERRRKRSQGDISKRTAWLMERTESALEKSALVRKRSEDLIQTGKRLRNEEV